MIKRTRPIQYFLIAATSVVAAQVLFHAINSNAQTPDISATEPKLILGSGMSNAKMSISEALDVLAGVPPLQVRHFSWGLSPELIAQPDRHALRETIRLTGGASFAIWHQPDEVVRVLRTVVDAHRASGQTPWLAVNYSPWVHVSDRANPATMSAADHAFEVAWMEKHLGRIRDYINVGNDMIPGQYRVRHVLLDGEAFWPTKPPAGVDPQLHSDAITKLYNTSYDIAKSIFPDARVSWYAFGTGPIFEGNGWGNYTGHTMDEKSYRCWTPILFSPQSLEGTTELVRRQIDDGRPLIPWLSMPGGYRPLTGFGREWVPKMEYPWEIAWQLGARVNNDWYTATPDRIERFGPWQRIEVMVLYPSPFEIEGFPEKFGAYVAGAHDKSREESLRIIEAMKALWPEQSTRSSE